MKIVLGVSGASGSIYGLRLLEKLHADPKAETHLILTKLGERIAEMETGKTASEFRSLADFSYPLEDVASRLASGSYPVDAMVVAPCSVHSMSAIANGIASNLLLRAADVTLKERRKLILLVRETPLHLGHLRTMVHLTEMGAIIVPPAPAFYCSPKTVSDIVDQTVDRVLDLLGCPSSDAKRWEGTPPAAPPKSVTGNGTPEG